MQNPMKQLTQSKRETRTQSQKKSVTRGRVQASEELLKMHQHFTQTSAGKLVSLIRRAFSNKENENVKHVFESISENREECSEYSVPQFRFHNNITKEIISFDREIYIQNGIFITYMSAEYLRNEFVNCWEAIVPGRLEQIRLDPETSFP